jgi:hypothetical protein
MRTKKNDDEIVTKKGGSPKYAYALTSKENFSIEYSVHQHNKMRTHNWPNLDTLITQEQDFFYRPLMDQLTLGILFYVGYRDLMVVGKPIKKIHVKPTSKPYKKTKYSR